MPIFELLGRRAAGAAVVLLALAAGSLRAQQTQWSDAVYLPGKWVNGRVTQSAAWADSLALVARIDYFLHAPKWRAEIRRSTNGQTFADQPDVIINDGSRVVVVTQVGSAPFAEHALARDPVATAAVAVLDPQGRRRGAASGRITERATGGAVARVVFRRAVRGSFDEALLNPGGSAGRGLLGEQHPHRGRPAKRQCRRHRGSARRGPREHAPWLGPGAPRLERHPAHGAVLGRRDGPGRVPAKGKAGRLRGARLGEDAMKTGARCWVLGVGLLMTTQSAEAQSIGDRLRRAAQGVGQVAQTFLPISTEKEIDIGRGIAATVAGRYPVSTDTALNRYVNLVGLAVAGEFPRADIVYRFGVLETPDVNAFASPGGYIFITHGALNLMESESELAGVLGHEVGHVNRRHVIEQIRKSDQMRAVHDQAGISGTVLDQVVGSGANVLFSGLGRNDELEADSLGFEYAASAGYDPGGLSTFIAHLNSHSGEGPVSDLMATHPRPADRIAQLQRIADRAHYPAGAVLADRYRTYIQRKP